MKELLDKILKDCTPYIEQGKLESYIPKLAKADKNGNSIAGSKALELLSKSLELSIF